MNNMKEKCLNLGLIKIFVVLIYIFYGLELLEIIVINLLGIMSYILRQSLVDYTSSSILEFIASFILASGMLFAGYYIYKFKKIGLTLFTVFFSTTVLVKILMLSKERLNENPSVALGLAISFVFDIIFLIYFVWIIIKYKENFNHKS